MARLTIAERQRLAEERGRKRLYALGQGSPAATADQPPRADADEIIGVAIAVMLVAAIGALAVVASMGGFELSGGLMWGTLQP